MKKLKFLTIVLATMLMCGHIESIDAQTTIGSSILPEKATLLDLKTKEAIDLGGEDAEGGFLLPRVYLTNQKNLEPLLSPAGMTSKEYTEQMLAHTGLMVYNVGTSVEKLNSGVNIWDGKQWVSLVATVIGTADYSMAECSSITLSHPTEYKVNTPLDAEKTMTIAVNVTKTGTYEIVAKPDISNGYYFSASGSFHEIGDNIVLELRGVGTPVTKTTNAEGDRLVITLNNQNSGCNKTHININ